MSTSVNIVVGSHVWVGDPELVWVDGEVSSINGDEAEIQTSNGKMVVSKLSKLHPKDMEVPEGGVDDMTKLSYLHEPAVLHNLAARYEINEIYTYTGNILIAINPFQNLSNLYDVNMMDRYKGASFGELSPHVFAIADAAYRQMINEGKSNSILVSGESGAGKTETTKMLMRYLAFLGGNKTAAEGRTVEQQVLEPLIILDMDMVQSNPVLEAFGNAKTSRNNNSSRFGKFVEIQFNKHGRISGAAIRTYLLERSRVCQISDPERNYHCFYFLCASPPQEREKYKLASPSSFHYLNQSNCYELADISDAHNYLTTRRAMDIVGISESEQEAIFRVVAAILHLGNIEFAKGEDNESSIVKDEESLFHLQMTSELLMCDPHALEDALCKRVMITPEEIIKRSLDPLGATVSRDGLAKTIYCHLFDWLVDKINVSIGQDPSSNNLIGVLDIYGFESFKTNSFEQLCINYTNEKLQQHFNQNVFKLEQEEYTKEEIDWSYIEFIDNQAVLDLIEKKPGGIIALLDEACMFPKSTHETFAQKLYQTFKDHRRFIKPKLTRSDFTIVHYAGEVQYQSDHFLDKNKDYVVPEHQDLLSTSKCSFVAGLFPPLTEAAKFSKFSSIVFESINVMQQLRSGGVLEAVRIKCAGYPTYRSFFEFLTRFGILAPEVLKGNFDEKEACIKILEKMGLKDYQIGKTKVFLRAGQMAELDARRIEMLGQSAKIIQFRIRSRLVHKKYVSMRLASIRLQSFWRGELARRIYKLRRREVAVIKIQKNLRRCLARKDYLDIRSSAIVLQSCLRAMASRGYLRYKKQSMAAITVQTSWRRYKAFSDYKRLKKASTISQNLWRSRTACRKIREEQKIYLEEAKREEEGKIEEEANRKEDIKMKHSLQSNPSKGDETDVLFECEAAQIEIDEACPFIKEPSSPDDDGKIETLNAEIKNLKVMLQAEKQRADEFERKYDDARASSEGRRKKLEETERRVDELQASLNRMIHSMSNQVAELKAIMNTPTKSRYTSGHHGVEFTSINSESSSCDSDFSFPAPDPSSGEFSPLSPNSFKLMVQDISAEEISGSESDKEGAFDDFF
ncbi:hypothetical protein FEM48_Zijuj09G0053800 [Ziziphus jujuba var. spinosa]|uniref:Myosin-11 n=1 Tax=Ziziphus jujuba var. spinosa TaxID=714518 RepID=A0A978UR46_ZIZJJ|nr:hypothetical protein FEM48_Zijuj09G0053800 [Ziziphus jujuba var. spinosa]